MMKRLTLTLLCATACIFSNAKTQFLSTNASGISLTKKTNSLGDFEFKQEVGGFYGLFMSSNLMLGDYGINYTPRLDFSLSRSSSISIDAPICLGLNFAVNSRSGGSGSFTFQLPVKATYNYGLGANDRDDFGFFIGGGLGSGFFALADGWYSGGGISIGGYADAGVRFNSKKWGDLSLALNGMVGSNNIKIFGLRAGRML